MLGNEHAFPRPHLTTGSGLTKREYAAIHIFAALAGGITAAGKSTGIEERDNIIDASVKAADALFERLGK